MDKNNDGVVTIEEFLETCQKVFPVFSHYLYLKRQILHQVKFTCAPRFSLQDENIMQSMHLFDNVI